MKKKAVPIYSLKEVIEGSGQDTINPDLLVAITNPDNRSMIALNYPSRVYSLTFILVCKGNLVINVDSNRLSMVRKDFTVILPNNVIEFLEISTDSVIYYLLTTTDLMAQLGINLNSQNAIEAITNNYSGSFNLSNSIFLNMKFLFRRLRELIIPACRTDYSSQLINAYLGTFFYEILNFIGERPQASNHLTYRKEDVALKFMGLIAQYYLSQRSVSQYAQQLHISRKHLTRTIKNVFNKSPKQIIEDKIIAEAKVLLLRYDLDIAEIIDILHFNDHTSFSKFFKRKTGFTPTMYRKEMQKRMD